MLSGRQLRCAPRQLTQRRAHARRATGEQQQAERNGGSPIFGIRQRKTAARALWLSLRGSVCRESAIGYTYREGVHGGAPRGRKIESRETTNERRGFTRSISRSSRLRVRTNARTIFLQGRILYLTQLTPCTVQVVQHDVTTRFIHALEKCKCMVELSYSV